MAPVACDAIVASALVWSSLLPDHMMTSAGDVFVSMVFLWPEFPDMAVLAKPMSALATAPVSPVAYAVMAFNNPCPASAARFGSFKMPFVE